MNLFQLLLLLISTAWARGGGGCFLAGTPILLPDGTQAPIETLHPGMRVSTFDPITLEASSTRVVRVFSRDVDSYNLLQTETETLEVTDEHPLLRADGYFRRVDSLRAGDWIYHFHSGHLETERIVSILPIHKAVRVWNLEVETPHTYFAGTVAVHNKGGGGGHGGGGGYHGGGYSGHHYSSGSSSGSPDEVFGLILIVILVVFVVWVLSNQTPSTELDHSFSLEVIAAKSVKTVALIEFLATQDKLMDPRDLVERARTVFLKLQKNWESRKYQAMEEDLFPDLFKEHERQLAGMIRNHEINRIEEVQVHRVDLVGLRYTEKVDQREFTALISAEAKDYYVDDESEEFIRGDEEPARFQEFWTFQLQNNRWLLREIEQTQESGVLTEENFVEQMTDRQIESIYQGKVDELGDAGPALEKEVHEKGSKTERLLNFLVQIDPLWARQKMLERARQVFMNVHLSLEAGQLSPESRSELFPNMVEGFDLSLKQAQLDQTTLEYRNLCVRKVEILLVRNFTHIEDDEFVARIRAHAQRIHRQKGEILHKDPDVRRFEEYWTFGRLDGQWKLKSAAPPADVVGQENIDQDTSVEMVKWYYTKKRAN